MRKISPAMTAAGAQLLFILPLMAGCGYGLDWNEGYPATAPYISISIDTPTTAPTYSTTQTGIRLGGTISNASFVHVRNAHTGFTTEGFVFYNQGHGTWFADVQGLAPGDNLITATADANGTGARTASANITVIRPLQPADLIINGPDQVSTNTFWTDVHSFNASHKIALFGDGTGRSTTGAALTENAGAASSFTWSKLGPESIRISNCMTCSFQIISRISGSLGESVFHGQIESTGGTGELAVHAFNLTSGAL